MSLVEVRRNMIRRFLADFGIRRDTKVLSDTWNYNMFVDAVGLFVSDAVAGTPDSHRVHVVDEVSKIPRELEMHKEDYVDMPAKPIFYERSRHR